MLGLGKEETLSKLVLRPKAFASQRKRDMPEALKVCANTEERCPWLYHVVMMGTRLVKILLKED